MISRLTDIHPRSSAKACLGTLLMIVCLGCQRPKGPDRPELPQDNLSFEKLYAQNCQACHGNTKVGGPTVPLNDRLFLAIISDDELRQTIAEGRTAHLMPGFAEKVGGALTDAQIDILVSNMRAKFGYYPPDVPQPWPKYKVTPNTGDLEAGRAAFKLACACCHGEDGKGIENEDRTWKQGPINDGAFLSLVSDQMVRRLIITGWAEKKMPNFHSKEGRPAEFEPLTEKQIDDLVALIRHWRTTHPYVTREP